MSKNHQKFVHKSRHIRAYLSEDTVKRLEFLTGDCIRTGIDFYLNKALDGLVSGQETKRVGRKKRIKTKNSFDFEEL